jgi:surface antigen
MARKKADTASTDFHQQNALSGIPMGQSLVWMEITGQSNSGQVTVGEDTTVLVKAALPGDMI